MMWGRSRIFLREAGTVILVCSMVLWVLLSFPKQQVDTGSGDGGGEVAALAAEDAHEAHEASQLQNSYAGRLGKAIEPGTADESGVCTEDVRSLYDSILSRLPLRALNHFAFSIAIL